MEKTCQKCCLPSKIRQVMDGSGLNSSFMSNIFFAIMYLNKYISLYLLAIGLHVHPQIQCGNECSVNVGDGERLLSKLPPIVSWKRWQKELQRRKLGAYSNISQPSPNMLTPWSTLRGCPLRTRRAGGRKSKFGWISNRPLNTLKAAMRSSRSRRRCKEWRPSRCSLSS